MGRPIRSIEPRLSVVDTRTAKPLGSLTQARRIRGRALQKIRAELFQKNPLCVDCEKRGIFREWVHSDHIVALGNGGAEDKSNRQGLCEECHDKKTRLDRKGMAR